jgi:type IV pilus assembly protein PilC
MFPFNSQISWKSLAAFCRSLGTMLHSGVDLLRALKVAGQQSADPKLSRAATEVISDVKAGSDLTHALREQSDRFPELTIDMLSVAEQTGAMPEVLAALANHYDNLIRLRKTFLGQIAWPVFQLLAAIFIVAALLVILGWVADLGQGEPLDFLFGLKGVSGAVTWLTGWAILAVSLWLGYGLATRGLVGKTMVHRFLMRVPVVGGCLRDFAIARFAWAYALTQQAGMTVPDSLDASLRATANGAFIAEAPRMIGLIKQGEDLTTAFATSGLFPNEVLELVRVGEATGTVPEALERLSPELEARARRSLDALTAMLGIVIWAMVAMVIIFLVFRVAMIYIGMLNDAATGAMNGTI